MRYAETKSLIKNMRALGWERYRGDGEIFRKYMSVRTHKGTFTNAWRVSLSEIRQMHLTLEEFNQTHHDRSTRELYESVEKEHGDWPLAGYSQYIIEDVRESLGLDRDSTHMDHQVYYKLASGKKLSKSKHLNGEGR